MPAALSGALPLRRAGSRIALRTDHGCGRFVDLAILRCWTESPLLSFQPNFPDRFEGYDHALDCSRRLIDWYNHHHRHWNLGLLTPAAVHTGAAGRILDQRRVILKEAYALHPERFVRGIPRPSKPAAEVWINPPENVAIRRAIQIPRDTDFITQLSQSH